MKLDFSLHTNIIISKAYKKIGFLKRKTKDFSNLQTLKVLYFNLVRAKLEHCSLIWDPYYINKIKILEQIQTKFLRYLCYKNNSIYVQDISSSYLSNLFNLPNLNSHRNLFCLLFFYKVIKNKINCNDILGSIQINVPSRFFRNNHLFVNRFAKFNSIGNFSLYKFYKIFNFFSSDLDIFNMSISAFKSTWLKPLCS